MSQNPQPSVVGVKQERRARKIMQLTLRKSNLAEEDWFTASAIRRVVHSFYRVREHPTLDKVLAHCEEDVVDCQSSAALHFGDC